MEVSFAFDHPVVAGITPQRVHLLVRLETWPEEGGPERTPLNLGLALDRSSSMSGTKLAATREAAMALVERLSPDDILSVVTFGGQVEIVLEPTPVADPEEIRRRLQGIFAAGNTNLSGGWLKALSLVAERRERPFLHRVLLLTDGQANLGVTEKPALAEIARRHRAAGIATTALGFGSDFDEGLLTELAAAGGGHFYYIDAPEKAPTAFVQEFGEIARVFGQNCEVRLAGVPGGPVPRVLEPEGGETADRLDTVSFGDVRERDRKRILAGFDLPANLPPGELELGAVQVAYDAVRGKVGARRHSLRVALRVDPAAVVVEPAPEVQREVVWHAAARLKRAALAKLAGGDRTGATADLERAANLLRDHHDLDPAVFAREAENLGALGADRTGHLPKNLTAQVHAEQTQSLAYEVAPAAEVKFYTVEPRHPEAVADIAAHLRATMLVFRYPEDTIRRLELALRELVANALEHGCKGGAAPRVDVGLQLARNHAEVTVRDGGPGFDFAAALAAEERDACAQPARMRGRGLLMVHRSVDYLAANAAGNELRASVRREGFHLHQEDAVHVGRSGPGVVAILHLVGFLDSHTFGRLEAAIESRIRGGTHRIVVDLSRCDYISSAGFGVLFSALARLPEMGGGLVLVNPPRAVREVFDLLGGGLFVFAATIAEAQRHFG